MKDKRFIELINLCVDHQLTPDEARELENELHANPARQRVYRQYCRMQKACEHLFEAERANAPATPRLARALASADRKITHPARRAQSPWWRNPFAIGGVATAAIVCAAVFFVHRGAPNNIAPDATASVAVAPSAPVSEIAAVESAQPAPMPAIATAHVPAKRFRLPTVTSFSPEQNTTPAPLVDDAVFAWTKDLQLRPIRKVSTEDMISNLYRLEKKQPGALIFHLPALETDATQAEEMTAIEFKR